MTYIIPLPWDRPPLSMNEQRRLHHQQLAKRVAEIKGAVTLRCRHRDGILWRGVDGIERETPTPKLERAQSVVLVFEPNNNRRRDADGMGAALKPILDGIVIAGMLPDDSSAHVAMTGCRILPPSAAKRGRLWLEVTP